ncbi:hypothetical protein SAMN05519104_0294 [Rhizobiales bacterium GAS188]|nr:hypothetical protein SAMN05519104_0294 [Rhizobiales bacterium GAS188]
MAVPRKKATFAVSGPQTAIIRWRTSVPGRMAHRLWVHPDEDQVLVSDGWGVAFAALRLRVLRLDDGREVASTRLGNAVRALTRSLDGSWLAASDTKLFRLDGATLAPIEKWTSRIPRYADRLVAGGQFAHACNHSEPSLHAVNLATGAVKRRRLGSHMQIHPWNSENLVAACGDGRIWVGSFGLEAMPRQIASTPAFCDSALDGRGRLWLSLGMYEEKSGDIIGPATPTSCLACMDLLNSSVLDEVDLGLPFWQITASQTGKTISVIATSRIVVEGRTIWRRTDVASFQASDFRCISWVRVPDAFEVLLISPDKRIALAARSSDQSQSDPAAAELICFNF